MISCMNQDIHLTTPPTKHKRFHEIEAIMAQRNELRQLGHWEQADRLTQQLLRSPYHVRVVDYKNNRKPSEWRSTKPEQRIEWQLLMTLDTDHASSESSSTTALREVPLIFATVDSPSYRERYRQTLAALEKWQAQSNSSVKFIPEPCFMLNRDEHPSINVKSIVWQGWRRLLLPYLLLKIETQTTSTNENNSDGWQQQHEFILVAEDDVRFPSPQNNTTPGTTSFTPQAIYSSCQAVFDAHPDLHVLSLGHSWNQIRKLPHNTEYTPSLLDYLRRKRHHGIHAATLVAIRTSALNTLATCLERAKPTHLDQFLFFSFTEELNVAVCDPPLAGWAEVQETLTPSASGHRRKGGGRLGFVPPPVAKTERIQWIQKRVVKNEL